MWQPFGPDRLLGGTKLYVNMAVSIMWNMRSFLRYFSYHSGRLTARHAYGYACFIAIVKLSILYMDCVANRSYSVFRGGTI